MCSKKVEKEEGRKDIKKKARRNGREKGTRK